MEDMEINQILVLGQIAKSLISAMGMQAGNKQREIQGHSMAYLDEDFFNECANIDRALDILSGNLPDESAAYGNDCPSGRSESNEGRGHSRAVG